VSTESKYRIVHGENVYEAGSSLDDALREAEQRAKDYGLTGPSTVAVEQWLDEYHEWSTVRIIVRDPEWGTWYWD